MKQLLLTAVFTVFAASVAMANPNTGTGLIPTYDFAMQGELNVVESALTSDINSASLTASQELDNAVNSINYSQHVQTEQLEAGIAGATALAMLPNIDGGVSMGVGVYESGSSLALGYSDAFDGGVYTKVGLTLDNKQNTSFGAGIGYKFK